jgi:hypothetical protein
VANPQNLNRFGYVLDNPIRFNDPTGHVCTDPEHPNPTCYGSPLTQTKVGNRMIRGNGAELRNLSIYKPKPPQRTFHTSFQMFPALPNSTGVETYTDFSTGGNPEYTPMLPYAPGQPYHPINDKPTSVNQTSNFFQLLNQIGMNILPAYYQLTLPYNQHVSVNYTTSYQNTPRIDATSVVTLTGFSITNSSNFIDSVIKYSVDIAPVGGSPIVTGGSAAPGETAVIPVPSGMNIYNGVGGINVSIRATTMCVRTCFQTQNPPVFQGAIRFYFNP